MGNPTSSGDDKQVYRVEGSMCANCAGIFEKNVRNLAGVVDAKVNFGTSKVTVQGTTTVQELEKAGSFENLKVKPEKDYSKNDPEQGQEKESFLQKHMTILGALLFVAFGLVSQFINDEENLVTVLAFATSMVIGGYSLFKVGFMNLIRFQFDMKTLMTVAVYGGGDYLINKYRVFGLSCGKRNKKNLSFSLISGKVSSIDFPMNQLMRLYEVWKLV